MKKIFQHIIVLFFFSTISSNILFAQGEADKWYFGRYVSLDFTSGAPVVTNNGQLNAREGGTSISDAAGNLLFYSDGLRVWNRNHVVMPNGFGLLGDTSSTQCLIIQRPGSNSIYYIFTTEELGLADGLRYTEVDLTLNGGLGAVTANKNILLHTPTCEKVTGIRHCNNQDVWVLSHDASSNAFRTFLVTVAGVNPVPVISSAGPFVGTSTQAIGQLKGSPNGNKVAMASYNMAGFHVFDFNNMTGIVSNGTQLLPQKFDSYGVEFSPDGTKLYCSSIDGDIHQFDLCAGSNAAIIASGLLIGTSVFQYNGSLQLAPDNKIYFAKDVANNIGAINNPNVLGLGCGFVDIALVLGGRSSGIGLPNFVPYYFKKTPAPFISTINCMTGIFTSPSVTINNCSAAGNAITSLSWNFGDPASGGNNVSSQNNPTHVFSNAGNYTVTLVLNYACGSDTIQQTITAGIGSTTITQNPQICNGNSFTLPGGSVVNAAGTYVDTLQSFNGCDSIITTNLTVDTVVFSNQNPIICSGNSFTLPGGVIVNAAGVYQDTILSFKGCDSVVTTNLLVKPHSSSTQNATICSDENYTLPDGTIVAAAGVYSTTVVAANGCDSVITTTLVVNPSPVIGISPDVTIAIGDATTITASGGATYVWTPSTGLDNANSASVVATPTVTTTYCVIITNSNGCVDSACVVVKVEAPCSEIENLNLPNAFSPNADGMNDEFCLQGWGNCIEDFSITIFDRWGEKVFESKDPNFCWNGKYKNVVMDAQVFVYYLSAKFQNVNSIVKKRGNISLLR